MVFSSLSVLPMVAGSTGMMAAAGLPPLMTVKLSLRYLTALRSSENLRTASVALISVAILILWKTYVKYDNHILQHALDLGK